MNCRRSRAIGERPVANEVEANADAAYYIPRQACFASFNKIWVIALECTRY
jgi:hypothetical protein